jgi:hypothetical protein
MLASTFLNSDLAGRKGQKLSYRFAGGFVRPRGPAARRKRTIEWRQTMHLTRRVLPLLMVFVAGCGSHSSTVDAQASGWNGGWATMEDPVEHAFTLDVPKNWKWSGGAYRLGYGDIRVMVDVWSPDGKTNLRFGDLWLTQQYALPNQYHREGEAQDLGALGQGTYAAYQTGQQMAELYAGQTFREACKSLTAQKTESPLVKDTAIHRDGSSQASEGEVSYRCETPQGIRIAYAYAKTTRTTSQPLANLPPTTAWTPQLMSYLAPPDQAPAAASIARHFGESFKISPKWSTYQAEMDKQGTAYAIARAQRRMTQQQEQFAAFTQRMNEQVSRFQQGQARQQGQVDSFLNVLNGVVPTNDPQHPLVPQGTHQGKWNCSGRIVDSDLSPGLGCTRIN